MHLSRHFEFSILSAFLLKKTGFDEPAKGIDPSPQPTPSKSEPMRQTPHFGCKSSEQNTRSAILVWIDGPTALTPAQWGRSRNARGEKRTNLCRLELVAMILTRSSRGRRIIVQYEVAE